METAVETARQDQETWTRLVVSLPRGYLPFVLWRLTRGGVTVCAPSVEAARARLAARLGEGT